jgi:hypothetical protein
MNGPIRLAAVALSTSLLAACGGGDGAPPALLVASTPALALAASGTTRLITVTNQGPDTTVALQARATGLPAGSALRSACPAALQRGESCLLLVTPGDAPSSSPGDLAPVPAQLTVGGANTNALNVAVSVLTHGNVHQGGYVFALDDRTPITGGVGGKVLAPLDTNAALWSPSLTAIAGISEDSTAGPDSCDGAVDGRCNTRRILAHYTAGPRDFAAALCADSRQGGFDDWYLPALCEMGYNPEGAVNGVCGTQAAPRLPDNATSRLFDQGPIGDFRLFYWSSSQSSLAPANEAHVALFGLGRPTTALNKQAGTLPSRCARAIIP